MDFNTLLTSLEAGDTEKATEIAKALKPEFEQTVKDLKDYEEKFSGSITSRDKAKAKLREVAEALGLSEDNLSTDTVKELIKVGKDGDKYKADIDNLTELIANNEAQYKSSLEEKDKAFSTMLVKVEIAKLGLNSDVVNDKALDMVMSHLQEGATIEDGVVVYKDGDATIRNGAGRPIGVAERMEQFKADESNSFLFKPTIDGGGGAKGNGATGTKKFSEYTGAELTELFRTNPTEYQRIKDEHYKTA